MLPVLVTFGRVIEASAKRRTSQLLRGLEALLPAAALRLDPSGEACEVPLDAIRPGDRLRVRPGERVPADGRVVEGATTIDEAAFTGEPGPRRRGPGDAVLAGTVNGPGAVVVEAERTGEALLLRRILAAVEAARSRPASSERLAERAAAAFIPAVLALAIVAGAARTATAGAAAGGLAALAVLVVACPCALGIATPLVTALAVGRAARSGAVVRGGDVLERIGLADWVCFDKTGTVTTGRPRVARILTLDPGVTEADVLGWLSSLESGSEHAVARAVTAEARARGIAPGGAAALEGVPGEGIRGRATWRGETRDVAAGTAALAGDGGAAAEPSPGAMAVWVAWDGRPRGLVLLDEILRPDAAEAVRRLRASGVRMALLSGDRAETAEAVARRAGLDRVEAPRRPDEKIAWIRARADEGSVVVMVGDGVNDAPALAAAGVGVALGAGTDLARQAGHVVLLSDRLIHVPWLIALSRRARRIVRQNLAWAFGYNAIALGAAAAGRLHPLLAALAMAVSSLTVLANAARIQRFPEPDGAPAPDRRDDEVTAMAPDPTAGDA
jgi:heavy metal translocating P-type ATPase